MDDTTTEDLDLQRPGYVLPSTVALPAGDEPVPCVVFFAGSGPTDRDWTSPLMPGRNGSAAQLARALAARGVGSIRFEPAHKTRVTIADANHVYKVETRPPSTISPAEIMTGYADDDHPLADAVIDAIVRFVTAAPAE